MPAALKILGGLIGLAVLILGGFVVSARISGARQARRVDALLEPVGRALREQRVPDGNTIRALAEDPLTPNSLGELLDSAGRLDLFPKELLAPTAIATSDMVYWLAHPHELGSVPDDIEHTAQVVIDAGPEVGEVVYFVFRFRMHEPHWAAKDGWMAGVAGPYRMQGEKVIARGGATFSHFAAYDSQTPDEHVRAVHDEAMQRGLLKGLARPSEAGAA